MFKVMFITHHITREYGLLQQEVVEFETREQARDAMTNWNQQTMNYLSFRSVALYLSNTK